MSGMMRLITTTFLSGDSSGREGMVGDMKHYAECGDMLDQQIPLWDSHVICVTCTYVGPEVEVQSSPVFTVRTGPNKTLGITTKLSTSFHLQMDGQNKFILIAWKLIFREGVVLQLSTPNIILMDLVLFLVFLVLSD